MGGHEGAPYSLLYSHVPCHDNQSAPLGHSLVDSCDAVPTADGCGHDGGKGGVHGEVAVVDSMKNRLGSVREGNYHRGSPLGLVTRLVVGRLDAVEIVRSCCYKLHRDETAVYCAVLHVLNTGLLGKTGHVAELVVPVEAVFALDLDSTEPER